MAKRHCARPDHLVRFHHGQQPRCVAHRGPLAASRPATCHRRIGHVPSVRAERSSGVLPRRRTTRRAIRCRSAGGDGASCSRPRKPRCGHDDGRTVGGAVQCWFIDVRTERRGDHTTRVGVSSRSGTADHRDPAAVSVPPAGAGRPAGGCGGRLAICGFRTTRVRRLRGSLLNRRSAMPFLSGRQMARVCCSGR